MTPVSLATFLTGAASPSKAPARGPDGVEGSETFGALIGQGASRDAASPEAVRSASGVALFGAQEGVSLTEPAEAGSGAGLSGEGAPLAGGETVGAEGLASGSVGATSPGDGHGEIGAATTNAGPSAGVADGDGVPVPGPSASNVAGVAVEGTEEAASDVAGFGEAEMAPARRTDAAPAVSVTDTADDLSVAYDRLTADVGGERSGRAHVPLEGGSVSAALSATEGSTDGSESRELSRRVTLALGRIALGERPTGTTGVSAPGSGAAESTLVGEGVRVSGQTRIGDVMEPLDLGALREFLDQIQSRSSRGRIRLSPDSTVAGAVRTVRSVAQSAESARPLVAAAVAAPAQDGGLKTAPAMAGSALEAAVAPSGPARESASAPAPAAEGEVSGLGTVRETLPAVPATDGSSAAPDAGRDAGRDASLRPGTSGSPTPMETATLDAPDRSVVKRTAEVARLGDSMSAIRGERVVMDLPGLGDGAALELRLRGKTVDARISLPEGGLLENMRSGQAELRAGLERQGLQSGTIRLDAVGDGRMRMDGDAITTRGLGSLFGDATSKAAASLHASDGRPEGEGRGRNAFEDPREQRDRDPRHRQDDKNPQDSHHRPS